MFASAEEPQGHRGFYYIDKHKFLTVAKPWRFLLEELARDGSQVQQDFRNRFPHFYKDGKTPFSVKKEIIVPKPIVPSLSRAVFSSNKVEQGLIFDHVGLRNEDWDDNTL
jgi:hypothetical protein